MPERFFPSIRGAAFFLGLGLAVCLVGYSLGTEIARNLFASAARAMVAASLYYGFIRFVIDPHLRVLQTLRSSPVGLAIYLASYALIFGLCLAL